MHATDWVPTLYTAAGGQPGALGNDLDGVDMWRSLNTEGPGKRQEVLINIDPVGKNSAIRVGDYKVVTGDISNGRYDSWYPPLSAQDNGDGYLTVEVATGKQKYGRVNGQPYSFKCGNKPFNASTNCDPVQSPCLYHIRSDPCEYHNIAASNPHQLHMVLDRLSVYRKSMVAPRNKPNDPRGDPEKHGGVWTPWE